MQPELSQLLVARKGHFRLESGHHGDLWLDLDFLFRSPARLQPFVKELASRLSKYRPAAVCGPLVGGAFLAQAVAAFLEVEFLYAERMAAAPASGLYSVQYAIPNGQREMVRGKTVVITDDAINAGSAVRSTFTDLEACGANPIAIGALIQLGSSASDFFGRQDIPLECLVQLPNNLWDPAACPLCAAQVPLEKTSA